MAMRRWEPLSGLSRLHEEMDRLFEGTMRPFWPGRGEVELEGYRLPTIDLEETDEEIVLKAELPGVDKKDLNVEVLPESVSLKAETSEEKEVKEKAYHRRERSYRSFQRVIPLPQEVKSAKAKASFKDGLLEVHLPKAEAAKAAKAVKVDIG
ncbi:MAG: Hsp20 family protein [Armatimonadetes bacterium]|nr:Hsp20 family protein [Armatimonadota bacterium]NIM23247.1 Hsp20 family protein [Armatimonadota bacterium]NIM67115.1 Hsp20 family protein [Armatimonadota bacterium]NIM75642.1 Hsp20 family protein [Armatimonadota bacterium]NIN05304.1 Hsp20 family protein [Armatimonadota bacterium]